MQRCSLCILPETYPGIIFDQAGVCNVCGVSIDNLKEVAKFNQEDANKQLLSTLLRYRGVGPYDCIVAFSGGRDSAYVLYYAVRILGLKVLAFTVDHGYLPDHTKENISNAVSILKVDHLYETHEMLQKSIRPVLKAWMHRPSAKTVSLICLGCRQAMRVNLILAARKHGSSIILNGSGESGTRDYLAMKFFAPDENTPNRKRKVITGFAGEILTNPQFLLHPELLLQMIREYRKVTTSWQNKDAQDYVRSVSLFEYIPWDEDEIMRTIQSELKWQKAPWSEASWRSDCKIAMLKSYLYMQTVGFTTNDIMVSEMIRDGKITREDGLKRIARENIISRDSVHKLCAEIGVAPERLIGLTEN